jgi:hypothetical protein
MRETEPSRREKRNFFGRSRRRSNRASTGSTRFGFGSLIRIELLNNRSPADRRAPYLVGTSRSVGRGRPTSHLLPDLRSVMPHGNKP